MKFKKIFSAAISAALVLTSIATVSAKDDNIDIVTDAVTTEFGVTEPTPVVYDDPGTDISLVTDASVTLADDGGDTATELTYVDIATADDLRALRDNVKNVEDYTVGKCFSITADIDLGGEEWEPIGEDDTYDPTVENSKYNCTFKNCVVEGNGHTISNYKITSTDNYMSGLIAMAQSCEIYDLNISNASIDISFDENADPNKYVSYAGLLVARAETCVISNVSASGSVSISNDPKPDSGNRSMNAGLIAGIAWGQFKDCTSSGTIGASNDIQAVLGGIVGRFYDTGIDPSVLTAGIFDSGSDCDISATFGASSFMGGITGICGTSTKAGKAASVEINNCSFGGTITSEFAETPNEDGTYTSPTSSYTYTGGITSMSYAPIAGCRADGMTVSAKAGYEHIIGGIVAFTYSDTKNCSVGNCSFTSLSGEAGDTNLMFGGVVSTMNTLNSETNPNSILPADVTDLSDDDYYAIIDNCTFSQDNTLTVPAAKCKAKNSIGGIASATYTMTLIRGCSADISGIDITGTKTGANIGGICGSQFATDIKQCTASGTLSNLSTKSAVAVWAGGIVGQVRDDTYYYTDTSSGEAVVTSANIGGIISDCTSSVNISALGSSLILGGTVGYLYGKNVDSNRQPTVERCYSSGTIRFIPYSTSYAGGLVGYTVDGVISDCRSDGSVYESVPSSKPEVAVFFGGFVGRIKQNSKVVTKPNSIVANCITLGSAYPDSAATGTTYGTFTSEISGNGNDTDPLEPIVLGSLYLSADPSAEDPAQTAIATPVTEEQLSDMSIYKYSYDGNDYEWDFDDVWTLADGKPMLRSQTSCIYDCHMVYENNYPTKIDGITVANAEAGSTLYAAVYKYGETDAIDTVYVFDVSDVNAAGYANIECDIDIPVLCGGIKLFVWDENYAPMCDAKTLSL